MNKKILFGILSILILLVLVFSFTTTGLINLNKNKETYKIGSILPLSGDASSFGVPFQKTLNLAVKEINENGGIDGKQVKIIYEDGKCENKQANQAANKLININNVNTIIGGICSGETLAAAPIAEENKVILFSPASGSPKIT